MNKFIFLLFLSISLKIVLAQEESFQKITIASGPEDFVIDENRLIISCAERRSKNKFIGQINALNFETEKVYSFEIKFLEKRKFAPHGISIISENNKKYLFVVNHVSKKTSEIICFEIHGKQLIELASFKDKTMKHLNSVAVVSLKEFYYTNDLLFSGSIGQYKQGTYQYISKGISYANGILIVGDEIIATATMGNKLFKLSQFTNKFKRKNLANLKGPDNIRKYGNDKLLIAGHTNISKFLAHAKDSSKISPFIIYEYNINTNKSKVIFEDNGEKISAVSSAIIHNGYLYIAQVFENFILKVKID